MLLKKEFCPICDSEVNLQIRKKELSFRKENFEIFDRYYKCSKCGEEFGTTETDEFVITQVYNLYREKHKILFPEEIKELRETFSLSKRKMSLLLGWGENTYGLYEGGAVPDEAHNNLLKAIKERPEILKKFALDRPDLINSKEMKNIERGIEKLSRVYSGNDLLLSLVWPQKISSFTGFTKPNIEKFANMVIYFLKKGIQFKVKLNKMLFYAEFIAYYLRLKSISGCQYSAIPMGPVPENYDIIFSLLTRKGYIDTEPAFMNKKGEVVEKLVALQEFDPSLFDKEELQVLELVTNTLSKIPTDQIIDISHQEKGWMDNQEKKSLINYQKYANQLKIIDLIFGKCN